MKEVLSYNETVQKYGSRKHWRGYYVLTITVKQDYWDTNTGKYVKTVVATRDANKKDMLSYHYLTDKEKVQMLQNALEAVNKIVYANTLTLGSDAYFKVRALCVDTVRITK